MPNKGDIRVFVITVGAIFAAGLLMNALRDNDWVKQAISGYDA
ncbi:hypothetical protein [Parvibaculum sp.]